MPAATNKSELLAVCEKDFNKLDQLLMTVDPATAMLNDVDDTSIKDVVGHRAHWIGLYLGWYNDGQAGKEVFFPAPGYKWNDLKRYNADLRSTQAELGWDEACALLHSANDQLVKFLARSSNEDLYGAPMAGANNTWTAGRWAEAAGPSHYRSAAKYVRSRLRP